MASSNYASWSVVAGEQPTTAKWNILGTNDSSFNSGLGFNDGIINTRHLNGTGISANTTAYTNASNAGGSGFWFNFGGLKILLIQGVSTNSTAWNFINWSAVGFTTQPFTFANTFETATPSGFIEFAGYTTGGSGLPNATGCSLLSRTSNTTNASATCNVMVIGK